jgi:hypothetical protein
MAARRLILFSVLYCLLTSISLSAKGQLTDTIEYSLKQKPKFFITLASFNTFIDHQYANISRIKMGLSYNQRIRFGIGFSSLSNNAVVSPLHIIDDTLAYDTKGKLNFAFVSLAAEYYFYNDYPWQCIVIPFQLGLGGANYEYVTRPDHVPGRTPSEIVILYQPEVSAQYNIFTWLGVGVTTGYRFTLYRSKKLTQNLSAPTFAIDLRLFVDEIYKIIFEKEEKN